MHSTAKTVVVTAVDAILLIPSYEILPKKAETTCKDELRNQVKFSHVISCSSLSNS